MFPRSKVGQFSQQFQDGPSPAPPKSEERLPPFSAASFFCSGITVKSSLFSIYKYVFPFASRNTSHPRLLLFLFTSLFFSFTL